MEQDAEFQMYAFYVTRGHTLEELVNLSRLEKLLMYHAMENYYKFIASLLGGKGWENG